MNIEIKMTLILFQNSLPDQTFQSKELTNFVAVTFVYS